MSRKIALERIKEAKETGATELDLSGLELTEIPEEVGELISLSELNLFNNQITEIKGLDKLTHLSSLSLSNNQIIEIKGLNKLTELWTLDLQNNQITEIKGLDNLTQLSTLDLRRNQIAEIRGLGKLTQLSWLDLSFNQITEIKGLDKLTQLSTLYLYTNQITEIKGLDKLTQLSRLDLDNNQITEIKGLDKLTKLFTLELSDNKIKTITQDLLKLNLPLLWEHLTSIIDNPESVFLQGNPLTAPPPEVIQQGNKAIKAWFEAEDKTKLKEIKIILIGDPEAGKTSLLRRLKEDQFKEKEVQTDGINIESIPFGKTETFQAYPSLKDITGYFWDFGGQEIMNATHQFFLTNRSVYILVLDARKDSNVSSQIKQWVNRIQVSSGNSPIIVVSNKSDINPGFGFENEYELQQEFPQIKYFIKVSSKDNDNIDTLKAAIEALIPQAEFFNTVIDARWIELKNQLQAETKDDFFLNEDRFIKISNDCGLTKKAERKSAIRFLHDLGLVLHFEHIDKNLSEYYVLDPFWITYGVYQIITSKYAGEQNGKIPIDQLEFIVNEEEDKKEAYKTSIEKDIPPYSTNQRRFLVDILNQFKLCFYTPARCHFIIPDLLDTKEPLSLTSPIREATEKIQFVYRYQHPPKSIMPYFMVESHHMVKKMWRTGCVIANEHCQALVSSYGRDLILTVTGQHKHKRELMSILRYELRAINNELNLNPKKLIPLPDNKEYVSYNVLLKMEERGRRYYDLFEPIEQSYEISQLLEGITSENELAALRKDMKEIKQNQKLILNKLDKHYQYLLQQLGNAQLDGQLLQTLQSISDKQSQQLSDDLIAYLTTAFTTFDAELEEQLKSIYTDLKASDHTSLKLKLGLPLVALLGVQLEGEVDVKAWGKEKYEALAQPWVKRMYKKYGLKVLERMEQWMIKGE